MPGVPSNTDIMMSLDGDLVIDGNGDFALTTGFDWLTREINKIVRTTNPTWRKHPGIGAGIERFIGRENTRETALSLQKEIADAILKSGLLGPTDVPIIDVTPISAMTVKVFISVQSYGIVNDVTTLIVDYDSGVIQDIPDERAPEYQPQTNTRMLANNKYLKRISNPQ